MWCNSHPLVFAGNKAVMVMGDHVADAPDDVVIPAPPGKDNTYNDGIDQVSLPL